jgi:hypothetical protein
MILASFVRKLVVAGGKATSFGSAEFLGAFAHHAIIVFTALAVLNQLSIAPELVQLLFAGMVFGTSLAFGLAFGLGGKDAAGKYVSEMTGKGGSQGGQTHSHQNNNHNHKH